MLEVPLDKRFAYDAQTNVLFIDFERLTVRTEREVQRIRQAVEEPVEPLGHKVYAIVNYNNFQIDPTLADTYGRMVRGLVERYYLDVTRYATSGFLRMKLGEALEARGVAAHVYESADDARRHLKPR
jgi:propionate CoA-transferase